MFNDIESIIKYLADLNGIHLIAVGEKNEGLLLGGRGSMEPLQQLVRQQAYLFRHQMDVVKYQSIKNHSESSGAKDTIEELLITLKKTYQLTYFVQNKESEDIFITLIIDKKIGNLALSRMRLSEVAQKTVINKDIREKIQNEARDDEIGHYKYSILQTPSSLENSQGSKEAPTKALPKGRQQRMLNYTIQST